MNLSTYDGEALTALYASLDFMKCNDLDASQVERAIELIEAKLK